MARPWCRRARRWKVRQRRWCAGGDQVSALVATQFAVHGLAYQTVATMASQIHDAFVGAMATGGTS
ncbi:PE family protein, partial [Mycobacterium interjectum]|uniref:PE family protein n=1 Tax=Mycobacterium interjectum TaxID=33895 RepID=UPI003557CD48